jgi:hypothetical protein
VLAAFSVFFMQCESFVEHQRQMHSRCGQGNAQSAFCQKNFFFAIKLHKKKIIVVGEID